MTFNETKLRGAFVIQLDRFEDERGFFALSWSEKEFADRGLDSRLVECNVSFNRNKGTLRGMHYQQAPHGQVKLVRCTMGAIYDCIIDLRSESPTFKQWVGIELTALNREALYVPKDFAHGFQTLKDDSEVLYQMSSPFVPGSGLGVRWNDPAFGIEWPAAEQIIIARDRDYADFSG
ncbi:MAG TPA: dTDP-4-dehydrorhamnose 3,5-epimerase [Pyrinomonadaceae bacterium]|jgi:dTDP-4-dehydrorhamnose 3,5-epimerase|nr:dTDP-4-dehydrorhamnose 3,5-epimerase [Pyrinomonadaceae bacterium]